MVRVEASEGALASSSVAIATFRYCALICLVIGAGSSVAYLWPGERPLTLLWMSLGFALAGLVMWRAARTARNGSASAMFWLTLAGGGGVGLMIGYSDKFETSQKGEMRALHWVADQLVTVFGMLGLPTGFISAGALAGLIGALMVIMLTAMAMWEASRRREVRRMIGQLATSPGGLAALQETFGEDHPWLPGKPLTPRPSRPARSSTADREPVRERGGVVRRPN
ncbi:MAG: hypothetical protein AAFP17_09025 [Pseudomonadota bacterium]